MTTEEKLNAIVAKCRAFLEIAEKRTPGEWTFQPGYYNTSHDADQFPCGPTINYGNAHAIDLNKGMDGDAAFIAACAGQAEAMARSTIAAINNLQLIHEQTDLGEYAAWDALQEIIAAWPDELLQTTEKP